MKIQYTYSDVPREKNSNEILMIKTGTHTKNRTGTESNNSTGLLALEPSHSGHIIEAGLNSYHTALTLPHELPLGRLLPLSNLTSLGSLAFYSYGQSH